MIEYYLYMTHRTFLRHLKQDCRLNNIALKLTTEDYAITGNFFRKYRVGGEVLLPLWIEFKEQFQPKKLNGIVSFLKFCSWRLNGKAREHHFD